MQVETRERIQQTNSDLFGSDEKTNTKATNNIQEREQTLRRGPWTTPGSSKQPGKIDGTGCRGQLRREGGRWVVVENSLSREEMHIIGVTAPMPPEHVSHPSG